MPYKILKTDPSKVVPKNPDIPAVKKYTSIEIIPSHKINIANTVAADTIAFSGLTKNIIAMIRSNIALNITSIRIFLKNSFAVFITPPQINLVRLESGFPLGI